MTNHQTLFSCRHLRWAIRDKLQTLLRADCWPCWLPLRGWNVQVGAFPARRVPYGRPQSALPHQDLPPQHRQTRKWNQPQLKCFGANLYDFIKARAELTKFENLSNFVSFVGRICLDILKNKWSPALQIKAVSISEKKTRLPHPCLYKEAQSLLFSKFDWLNDCWNLSAFVFMFAGTPFNSSPYVCP